MLSGNGDVPDRFSNPDKIHLIKNDQKPTSRQKKSKISPIFFLICIKTKII
jgi:hypothetical protein